MGDIGYKETPSYYLRVGTNVHTYLVVHLGEIPVTTLLRSSKAIRFDLDKKKKNMIVACTYAFPKLKLKETAPASPTTLSVSLLGKFKDKVGFFFLSVYQGAKTN